MIKNAFILNFFKFYNLLWSIALPFLKKNKRLSHGFEKRVETNHLEKADIWLQAASAGESYLAVEIIKTLTPDSKLGILVTTITSQGRDILLQHLGEKNIHPNIDCRIDWFPFDKPAIMEKAVQQIQPKAMVLLETEMWPALLFYLKKNNVPIAIINARLSRGSYNGYKWTRFLWKHLYPDLICTTSQRDEKRYQSLFAKSRVTQMNNIKFETLDEPDRTIPDQPDLDHIFPGKLPVTILASIRKPEEKQVLQIVKTVKQEFPNQIIAIFPRHMHRLDAWKRHLTALHQSFELRSDITKPVTGPTTILWDSFGELKKAYDHASVVFVGGSLKPLGGQNFLEPAMLGTPTVTGPFYDDFAWVGEELFDRKIVAKKKDWQAVVTTIVKNLNTGADDRLQKKAEARDYLLSRKGGTKSACESIMPLLQPD